MDYVIVHDYVQYFQLYISKASRIYHAVQYASRYTSKYAHGHAQGSACMHASKQVNTII